MSDKVIIVKRIKRGGAEKRKRFLQSNSVITEKD